MSHRGDTTGTNRRAVVGHNEIDCITDACGMWSSILEEADSLGHGRESDLGAHEELRMKLPLMYSYLSPAARQVLADHLDHLRELVADMHRRTNAYSDANRSSA